MPTNLYERLNEADANHIPRFSAIASPALKKIMYSDNLPKLDGFLPKQPRELYPSPGKCIYCGAKGNLSDEHIIPFALGGNLILQNSSCADCATLTSAFELTCLRTMYGPLRLLYDLPTRRPKKRPKKLPLKVKFSSDETE